MANYQWGDGAEVQIDRTDKTLVKKLVFRRNYP
jgi:hypothetical protein